ncbi:hypothetical protein AAG906_010102 [Vitis piasezkii]
MVSKQFLLLILDIPFPFLSDGFENNYNTWNRVMSMALTIKNKIGFVDGTIPCATQIDILFNAWNHCNNIVIAFKVLWEELKNFQPLPVYHCGSLQFVMGLNDSYAQTRCQILMMEPLPPLSKILLHLMLILGIKLRRQNMSDLNVATMDYRVIPSIVVINYMDTHLGPYARIDDWDGTFHSLFPSSTNSNPTTSTKSLISSTSRPTCVTKPPTYLQDYYCYFTTLAPIFVLYPLFSVLGYDKLSPSHRALIHAISSHVEPTSYTQATMIPEW